MNLVPGKDLIPAQSRGRWSAEVWGSPIPRASRLVRLRRWFKRNLFTLSYTGVVLFDIALGVLAGVIVGLAAR